MIFWAPGESASHSMPAYMSSEFSRKTTMSTCSGLRTGEGTPLNQVTGRWQT